MITKRIPIPYRGDDVQRTLCADVDCLIPSRIKVAIHDPCLCKTLLVLIAQNHVWVTESVHVTGFQVFSFDDLDGEDELA